MQGIAVQLVRKVGQVGFNCKQLPSYFVLLLLIPAFACRCWLLAGCVEHGHPVGFPEGDYVVLVVDHLGDDVDDDYEVG